jgi:hypothetical protein
LFCFLQKTIKFLGCVNICCKTLIVVLSLQVELTSKLVWFISPQFSIYIPCFLCT